MIKKFRRGSEEKNEITPKFTEHFKSARVRSGWDMPPLHKKTKVTTDRQLVQQKKWELASQFADRLAVALATAKKYDQYKGWQRSDLIRHLISNAITSTYPHFEINYSQVVLGQGTLNVYPDLMPSISANGKLTIRLFNSQSAWPIGVTDRIILCLYNPDTDKAQSFEREIGKSDLKFSMQFPLYQSGSQYHLWIFEASAKCTLLGNTHYFKL
jgi:hypothetical protein